MGKSAILKSDDFCRVTIEQGRGYIIRMHEYPGATFTVTEKGEVEIGQSSRMQYTYKDWERLQAEIQLGFKYMVKVITLKSYGNDLRVQARNIPVKEYRNLALYRRANGHLMFWIGKAVIFNSTCGFSCNREGSPYIFLEVSDDFRIIGSEMSGTCLNLGVDRSYTGIVRLESNVTQNKQFRELLWFYQGDPSAINTICVNGELVGSFLWNK